MTISKATLIELVGVALLVGAVIGSQITPRPEITVTNAGARSIRQMWIKGEIQTKEFHELANIVRIDTTDWRTGR